MQKTSFRAINVHVKIVPTGAFAQAQQAIFRVCLSALMAVLDHFRCGCTVKYKKEKEERSGACPKRLGHAPLRLKGKG